MKRVFCLILVCLCCSLLLNPFVFAAEPQIRITSAEAYPGEEISVALLISDNPGVAYLKLRVSYNSEELRFIKVENTGLLKGNFTTSKTCDVNPYVIQWMGAENSDTDGVIATLTFQVKESAAAGAKNIMVSLAECYNESFDDVSFSAVSGNVTVSCNHQWDQGVFIKEPDAQNEGIKKYTCVSCGKTKEETVPALSNRKGDVNNDGRISGVDCVLMMQCLAGWDVDINERAADINGDGKISGKDVVLIKQYLAGWFTEFP